MASISYGTPLLASMASRPVAGPGKQAEGMVATFPVVNPVLGVSVRSYDGHTPAETDGIVTLVHQSAGLWRRTPFAERARLMHGAAAVMRRRSTELCALMTTKMGKTLHEGRGEIEKCAFTCDHFADNAEAFLAPEQIDMGPGARAYTSGC